MTFIETEASLYDQAVAAIYKCALTPSEWPAALQSIADVFGDFGAIIIYGKVDGSFGVFCSPSMNEAVAEYAQSWSHRDVRANRTREKGYFLSRDVITDRDILTPEVMKTDEFYTDYLNRYGLKYFAAAMVSPDPAIEVGLSIQRRADTAQYNENELEVVRRIGRHVEQSLRIGIRLIESELLREKLGEVLDRADIGVIALGADMTVAFVNSAGRRIIHGSLAIDAGKLSFHDPETANKLIAAATGGSPPVPVIIPRSGKLALIVHAIPIRSEAREESFLAQTSTLLLVIDPAESNPADPAVIRDVFSLTLGEARVASLVGHGLSPKETAVRLNITEETARSVLKRVFSKTKVSRQGELAALLARLSI